MEQQRNQPSPTTPTPGTLLVPKAFDLSWPTLRALMQLGGSARIEEITPKVAELIGLTEDQQAIPHGVGSRTEFEYRLAWARTYLKNISAIENSSRGVWSVTERGRGLVADDILRLYRAWRAQTSQLDDDDGEGAKPLEEQDAESPAQRDWKSELLEVLAKMDPLAFERLFVRILREAGFVNVETTRASGDDGIDGTGVYQLSMISFPVYFQCKRWRRSIGSEEMRNFRGAMVGRAEHALFVTTSSFTSNAKTEATRPGAPPIDLIDGDRLCDFLRSFNLGVLAVPRTVYDVSVDASFFRDV